MKAKDLMIGDWVLHEGEPYQIRQLGIYGVDRDGEDYPAVCVGKPKGVGLIVERNEIEPIPLTPEILEKNGFGVTRNMSSSRNKDVWSLHVYENKVFHIIEHHNKREFPYFWIELGSNSDIKYVHQLQHALRLCGIKKEIEL